MFKYHKGILPAVFDNMFKTNSSFHNYPTRTRNNLCVPTTRSTRTHSIRFTGVHEWNSICQDFKSSSIHVYTFSFQNIIQAFHFLKDVIHASD